MRIILGSVLSAEELTQSKKRMEALLKKSALSHLETNRSSKADAGARNPLVTQPTTIINSDSNELSN